MDFVHRFAFSQKKKFWLVALLGITAWLVESIDFAYYEFKLQY